MKKALPRNSMLMLTPTERQYIDLALEALTQVQDERGLVQWEDCFTAGDEYLHLHEEGIRELETARRAKEAEFMGVAV